MIHPRKCSCWKRGVKYFHSVVYSHQRYNLNFSFLCYSISSTYKALFPTFLLSFSPSVFALKKYSYLSMLRYFLPLFLCICILLLFCNTSNFLLQYLCKCSSAYESFLSPLSILRPEKCSPLPLGDHCTFYANLLKQLSAIIKQLMYIFLSLNDICAP